LLLLVLLLLQLQILLFVAIPDVISAIFTVAVVAAAVAVPTSLPLLKLLH
jgi:hypothetical protein